VTTIRNVRSSDRQVRVAVGDGHTLYREGAVATLTASGYVDVVAEAADGPAALGAITAHQPEVALLDQDLPGLDGLAVAHEVRRAGLDTQVVILAMFADCGAVHQALQEGATGYLSKVSLYADLVDAVLDAANGRTVVPPELGFAPVPEADERGPGESTTLTGRERQVLCAVAAGKPVPLIARQLLLPPTSVRHQVQHACAKLGVSDKAAAVAEAARRGLLG
jgi:two-component system nitrate/nitrite response regulator NarL